MEDVPFYGMRMGMTHHRNVFKEGCITGSGNTCYFLRGLLNIKTVVTPKRITTAMMVSVIFPP